MGMVSIGSDCRGVCEDCKAFYVGSNCLAGHGDDHFTQATKDDIAKGLKSRNWKPEFVERMRRKYDIGD